MIKADDKMTHPTADELRAFGLGESNGDTAEIQRHLETCDACRAALEALPDDTLARLVRSTAVGPGGAQSAGIPLALNENDCGDVLAGHPRYHIEARLGMGGMGVVYRARHLLMDRTVALKVIHRQLTERPAVVERFQREVKAAARLSHANIVAAYDAERAGDRHFLVMEFVPGMTLAALVQKQGPLPVNKACDYTRQAALGLQYAHEHGLVHRDIKPQNLMVVHPSPERQRRERGGSPVAHAPGSEGIVKILDFGLARFEQELDGGVTTADTVMGTADFLAPEQADDPHLADIRSDLYSLGCTLYFLLTGKPPFPEGNLMQKLKAHALREPPPISNFCPAAPAGVDAVLRRMLAKEPARRYQTPAEVVAALTPFTEEESVERGARSALRGWRSALGAPRSTLRERLRRYVRSMVLITLLALAALGGSTVYRITTDYGELEITTNDPDVQLTFEQDGKNVRVVDLRTNLSLSLRSGDYSVKGAGNGAKVEVQPDRIMMKRGQKVTVSVKRHLLLAQRLQAPGRIGDVALSRDGNIAATAEGNGNIRLWNVAKGTEIACLEGHTRNVHDLTFTRDAKQLLSSSRDGTVRLWDVAQAKEVRTYEGHDGEVWAARISPDGRSVLTGCHDTKLRLFDLATAVGKKTLSGHEGAIECVEFAPDGRRALSCARDKTLRLWDLDEGREIRAWTFDANVRRLAWSRDGKRFLLGHVDGKVALWDVDGKKPLWSAQGHAGCLVYGVAMTADGRFAVTSGGDARVCFWDAQTGKEVLRHHEKQGEIYCIQLSADGCRLLTNGGWSKAARLYDLPRGLWPGGKLTSPSLAD